MNTRLDCLFGDLNALVAAMGSGGGHISPSVYDTAQVLRFYPPPQGTDAAVAWILSHQHPDGGWGNPELPLGRDVPTLAALLLLHEHRIAPEAQVKALTFLRQQAAQWHAPLPMDIPIGVEMILPSLLEEARAAAIEIPIGPYDALIELGTRRRALIARMRPVAGTSALHSWEAWGSDPDPALLDGAGGIGHSPSATAAWLRKAATAPAVARSVACAEAYLEQAVAATGTGIPGVVPTVFPIARFEELWLPYALLIAGLLDEKRLEATLQPLVAGIQDGLQRGGLGFSDHFDPDGDDTAAGLAVLLKTGHQVDLACLHRFEVDEHFATWRHEMVPSLSTTARAVHALSLAGENVAPHQYFLLGYQGRDGRWMADKWNESWLYTTCHAVAALAESAESAHRDAIERAMQAVLKAQHPGGGWGTDSSCANATETAYAVLTLYAAVPEAGRSSAVDAALDKAFAFLDSNYRADDFEGPACWIGKEAYRPYRVDKAFELIALTALAARHEACTASG